jgi:hypothetical protein
VHTSCIYVYEMAVVRLQQASKRGDVNIQIFSHLVSCSAWVIELDTEHTRLLQHGNARFLSLFPTTGKLIEIYELLDAYFIR